MFGISQIIIHGLITPKKIGNRIYSPGFIAVFFGHVPVGIYWFYYTISNGLLGISDIVFGFIYLALFVSVLMMKIGYGVLKNQDSKYPFSAEEFGRGGYSKRIQKYKGISRYF